MKLLIAGGRDYNDYDTFKKAVEYFIMKREVELSTLEIVSGGAKGADSLAEKYAKENGIAFKLFKANWDLHGKAAGPIRNAQMGEYSDQAILFWDGKSSGTKNMYENMKKLNKLVYIMEYTNDTD